MKELINKISGFGKKRLKVVGAVLLILLAILLLWFGNVTSMQSGLTLPIELYFKGEYRIADGPWQTYVEGEHISSTQGDVTLRGNLYKRYEGEDLGIYNSEDLPAAFYVNHISLTFCEIDENGEKVYTVSDHENPLFGNSNCGVDWEVPPLIRNSDEPLEILIHNPHAFGNETAIDELLSKMFVYMGVESEKEVLDSGNTQRNVGLLFVVVSVMMLGIALFSALIHIKNTKNMWDLGAVILCAGVYFVYSSDGISIWSESIVSNTIILGVAMMLYMFFFAVTISILLQEMQRLANITVISLGVANALFFILPIFTDILFYDTWLWWIFIQLAANVVLIGCLVKEFTVSKTNSKWICIGAMLPLIAFVFDVIGTWSGSWAGGLISRYVFIALFAVAMIVVLNLIPNNINAAAKARELEMEKIMLSSQLAQSRISTMMSQIRPHFIYNTLGSIEQLCKLDPPKAGELVHNFAKYLRGNFGELDNPKPILMSQEMAHVHHYISIENVRFPDMTFSFEMKSDDFKIPALTIQPIVENAIKHGLMKLQAGGTIRVVSFENDKEYCITVEDDGVGFDTSTLVEDRTHVGLRNIRERLKVMVDGTLEIESTVGVGTKVTVRIPKEER